MRGSLVALLLAVAAVSPLSGQAAQPASDAIVPFTINVPDAVLRDLKERLARTRFPDQLQNVGWDYGTDPAYDQTYAEITSAIPGIVEHVRAALGD